MCLLAVYFRLNRKWKKITWNHENQENQKNQEESENHENHKNQKYTITATKSYIMWSPIV